MEGLIGDEVAGEEASEQTAVYSRPAAYGKFLCSGASFLDYGDEACEVGRRLCFFARFVFGRVNVHEGQADV